MPSEETENSRRYRSLLQKLGTQAHGRFRYDAKKDTIETVSPDAEEYLKKFVKKMKGYKNGRS